MLELRLYHPPVDARNTVMVEGYKGAEVLLNRPSGRISLPANGFNATTLMGQEPYSATAVPMQQRSIKGLNRNRSAMWGWQRISSFVQLDKPRRPLVDLV